MRRDRDEVTTALTALATVHVRGAEVDWKPLFAGVKPADLPTYAFQRERYWPDEMPAAPVTLDRDDSGFWNAVERGDVSSLADRLRVSSSDLENLVPALAAWRVRENERSLTSGWRYRVTWEPATPAPSATLSGTWAVAGDDVHGLGPVLESLGATVVPLDAAPGALASGASAPLTVSGSLAVSGSPAAPGSLAASASLAGVIASPASLADALALVKGLAAAGGDVPLWLVTAGAVVVGRSDGEIDVDAAALWGFGRAVALEHPGLWGGLLDLPATIDSRAAKRIAAVLGGALGAEDQIAVRPGGVLVRRLTPAPLTTAGVPSWTPRGTVLVAGGTGGLGAQAARWVTARGAERLVLVSRRGMDAPGAAALLAELPGAEIHACDLADRTAVAELLAEIGPLDAVIHAAGVGEDVALLDADDAHLHRVVDGKVRTALNLDEMAGDLDAYIVFSSISGVWGSAQQAAYGAANAALDAVVARRRAGGRPGTAVAWGPWAEVGMAADTDVAHQLRRRGLDPMEPARALTSLATAVGAGDDQITIADVRWNDFLPLVNAVRDRPLFTRLASAPAPVPGASSSGSPRMSAISGLSPAERHRAVLEIVRAAVAGVLGHASAEAIEPDRAFQELGFDSLTAVELRNRIAAETGLTLPTTLVFDYPDAVRLTAFVLARLVPETVVSDRTVARATARTDDDPV
ncbi:SDR family NAD(P)-dependent oxidoreductase, partial [Actinoplanes derwentensis]|uniref:SDR family NAD(P)-dependent oxidoreductase n=1 Tax=Actinoplanes derwentensis TaxID=113562 RepID=UPI001942D71A